MSGIGIWRGTDPSVNDVISIRGVHTQMGHQSYFKTSVLQWTLHGSVRYRIKSPAPNEFICWVSMGMEDLHTQVVSFNWVGATTDWSSNQDISSSGFFVEATHNGGRYDQKRGGFDPRRCALDEMKEMDKHGYGMTKVAISRDFQLRFMRRLDGFCNFHMIFSLFCWW